MNHLQLLSAMLPESLWGHVKPRKPDHFIFLCPFSVISWVTLVGVLSRSQEEEALTSCQARVSTAFPFLPSSRVVPTKVGEHQPLVSDLSSSPGSAACSLWMPRHDFPFHCAPAIIVLALLSCTDINKSIHGKCSE